MSDARPAATSPPNAWGALRRRPALAAALAATFALLLAHAWSYRFLTDDAFISFRYARNLAEGHGLVFNPGFERVEGYTNFLWVLILAAFDRAGVSPENVANLLSMLCGVAIWWLVASRALRDGALRDGASRPAWLLVAPPLLLAATRSFAVWCTSGLETKLFELLVVAAVWRALDEMDAARRGEPERWVGSSLLLGLACLTRPDGAVIAAGLLAARWALERRRGAARTPAVARGVAFLAALLIAHLVFRLAYYGDWVPNTYHAKVGGRTWWAMGSRYAVAFAIEYGILFWLPLLGAAWVAAARAGGGALSSKAHAGSMSVNGSDARTVNEGRIRLSLFAGALVPHALYVIAIGGDHFEYRPFDLYFPFAFLLLADGAAALVARGRAGRAAAAALLALTLVNVASIPRLTRVDFPADYRPGFPGSWSRADGSRDLIAQRRVPALFATPLVGEVLRAYNALFEEMTFHAVAIRQEEHRLFLDTVVDEGRTLRRLVEEGTLPADTHIAIGSVGAIPYYSRLRTLDRLGLTDRTVATGPSRPEGARLMAHDKGATIEHGTEQGVDLWALDNVHLLFRWEQSQMRDYAEKAMELGLPMVAARADDDRFLLAAVPGGTARAAARLPKLADAREFFAREADAPDAPWWLHANLGDLLGEKGDVEGAVAAYETALRAAPNAAIVEHHLGALLSDAGDLDAAVAHLRRAIALDPSVARARFDLGLALVNRGELVEALQLLREGVAAAPADVPMSSVLARFLATCPDRALRDAPEAVRIGERLRALTRGRDARVLDTLATAYASAGRFAEAVRVARDAVAVARGRGWDDMAAEMQARADAYAAGRTWF